MKRRIGIALGLALAGTFAAVGLSAPANASTAVVRPAAYVLYQTFGWPDACSSAGYAGEQAGKWKSYYCDEIQAPSADAGGLVYLYVAY